MVRTASRLLVWVACVLVALSAAVTGKTHLQDLQKWDLLGGGRTQREEARVREGRAGQPAQGGSPPWGGMPGSCVFSGQELCPRCHVDLQSSPAQGLDCHILRGPRICLNQ